MDIQSSEESSAESDEEADNDEHDDDTDEIVNALPSMGKLCYGDRSPSEDTVQQKNCQW